MVRRNSFGNAINVPFFSSHSLHLCHLSPSHSIITIYHSYHLLSLTLKQISSFLCNGHGTTVSRNSRCRLRSAMLRKKKKAKSRSSLLTSFLFCPSLLWIILFSHGFLCVCGCVCMCYWTRIIFSVNGTLSLMKQKKRLKLRLISRKRSIIRRALNTL